MSNRNTSVLISVAFLALSGAAMAAQKAEPGVEVQMVVTSADHITHQPTALKPDDITIPGATVTDLVALEGSRADLDLFLLIDDAANYDFGGKLQELRRFVAGEPATASIGVAYIHDGVLQIAETPTADHARAAYALRAPSGSKSANVYCALSDLIQRWPGKALRREIVLVSTGIDDSAPEGVVCVTAETAIQDAERAGVVVYALYNPTAGYLSEKWAKVDSGVVDLAHVCYETGGEAYFLSHSPVDSIEPFLADIAEHLANQYLLKFRLSPAPESGFQRIYVISGSPDRELMKPESVWVP